MSSYKNVSANFGHGLLFTVLVVGLTVWCSNFLASRSDWISDNVDNRRLERAGQFGDSFGMANSLFTMIAMLGAAFAAYLQYTALQEQRQSQSELLAEQQRTTQAEAAATVAASVAAWTELSGRLTFRGPISQERLNLAIEENRNRVLLEIYKDAMIREESLSLQALKNSPKWIKNEAMLTELSILLGVFSGVVGIASRFDNVDNNFDQIHRILLDYLEKSYAISKQDGSPMAEIGLKRLIYDLRDESNGESMLKKTVEVNELVKDYAVSKLGLFEG